MTKRIAPIVALLLWSTAAWAQDDTDFEVGEPTAEGDSAADEERVETTSADSDGVSGEWWIDTFGYVRAGYDHVQQDPNFAFIGRNNGFVIHNARIGLHGGQPGWGFGFQVSIDGASDLRENVNDPQGDLDVRLRDAFVRYDLNQFVGAQVGQFKLPFSAEESHSTGDLMFVSRAVGLQGIPAGRGHEQEGLVIGRELGVMLSSPEPIRFTSGLGFAYYAAVANGNGSNELLNDNNSLAIAGRLELYFRDYVRVGGSYLINERTEGELPNLFEETDSGFSVDLLATWEGLELFAQYTALTTEFVTDGVRDREQSSLHAQLSYRFDQLPFDFAPAYRFAMFDPNGEAEAGDGSGLDSLDLTYHTAGLRIWIPETPIVTNFNYTITGEEAGPRELENNRFEALAQIVW